MNYSQSCLLHLVMFLVFLNVNSCTKNVTDKTLRLRDLTIIAHRGASAYLPEHTLAGVAMAHGFNPDYIEPDIVLTKDDQPIILHDIHLEANTNVEEIFPKRKRKDGRWYAIDFTLKEIKTLNVHERTKDDSPVFKGRFPLHISSFQVPSLSEYIELIQGLNKSRGKDVGIYPEIKAPSFHKSEGKDILGVVMETLERYGYNKKGVKIFLQCFDPDLLQDFKKRYPESPIKLIQLIADNSWAESIHDYKAMRSLSGLKKVSQYAYGIGVWIPFLKQEGLVMNAHNVGMKVHAYTLRDKSKLKELIKLDIDGVFTDYPELGVNE